jgi:Uma2 family endonuclease
MVTVNPTKHLTNLDEWRRLGEAAIFSPDSRLELINGEILEIAPIGFNHPGHLNRLNKLLTKLAPDNVIASVQNPLQLGDFSEPEPDFMLQKPKMISTHSAIPSPAMFCY